MNFGTNNSCRIHAGALHSVCATLESGCDARRSHGNSGKDLRGGAHGSMKKTGDTQLEKLIRALFKALGYDESLELEEAPYVDPISHEDL